MNGENSQNTAPTEEVTEFFKCRIAEKNIEIECLHRQVFKLCRDYLAQFDSPDLVIAATREDIEKERIASAKENEREGLPVVDYGDAYLETLAVYRKLAEELLCDGILLVHGAVIACDGKGYIFLAKSGTGKTTHIKNWLKMIPGTYVVNGDKPLIDTAKRRVFGTPWCGKEGMNTNTSVPLGGLVVLERGKVNEIRRITFREALPCILQQTYRPSVGDAAVRAIQCVGGLKDVPCFLLHCNMDADSATVAHDGIFAEQ